MTHLENPINDYQALDALLVLGGEDQTYRPRSNTAKMVYGAVTMRRDEPLPIILSGLHSALFPDSPVVESREMRDYLLDKGLPRDALFCEARAMDTVGNFAYSRPYFEQMDARRIGVVTDDYHMERALWIGKRVLGSDYALEPITTGNNSTMARRASETASFLLLRNGLRGIPSGDTNAINAYLAKPRMISKVGQLIGKLHGDSVLKRLRNS